MEDKIFFGSFLRKEFLTKVSNKRNCDCFTDNIFRSAMYVPNFCPNCGKKWADTLSPLDKIQNELANTKDLAIIMVENEYHIICTTAFRSMKYGVQYLTPCGKLDLNILEEYKLKIKNILDKYHLWDSEMYGIWHTNHYSEILNQGRIK